MIGKIFKILVLTVAITSTVVTASFAAEGKDAFSVALGKSVLRSASLR